MLKSNHNRIVLVTVSFILIGALLCSLAGCASSTKKDYGTWLGAIGGGVLGGVIDDGGTGGIIVGTIAGGLLGRMIGHYMDESDRKKAAEALESTATGATTTWVNESSGAQHSITPKSDIYATPSGNCREFEQEVYVDGKREVVTATACKQAQEQDWSIRET